MPCLNFFQLKPIKINLISVYLGRYIFVLISHFQAALLSIVLRDSFAAPEKDIFQALMNWCKHNPKENHAEIMQAVRLPLMSLTELLNVVRPSGLLSPDAILDAIKIRSESRDMDLNYRGMLSKHQVFCLFIFHLVSVVVWRIWLICALSFHLLLCVIKGLQYETSCYVTVHAIFISRY